MANTNLLNFWMVEYWQTYFSASYLDGETKTFGNSPIFSPSKYFPRTVYYQSHILCTYIGSPNVTDLELKVRICKTFYVIKILLCCYMLTVVCLLVSRFFADASSLCNHSQSPSVSGYFTWVGRRPIPERQQWKVTTRLL